MRQPWAGLVVLAILLSGCQLVDRNADLEPAESPSTAAGADQLLGNPDEEFPTTLAELRAYAAPEALIWQDEPVLADVTVWLDPRGLWERVRVTYVAPDSDRMLTLRADPEQLRLERPRLEGLQLMPLPSEAVEAIPPLPDDVLEPRGLAEASSAALAECGDPGGTVRKVVYATGAPAAWDGQEWTVAPTWEATVVTSQTGVVVAPGSGRPLAPLRCVEPLLDG